MVLYELMHTGSGFAVPQVLAALRFFQSNQVRFVRFAACGKNCLPVCKGFKNQTYSLYALCQMYTSLHLIVQFHMF